MVCAIFFPLIFSAFSAGEICPVSDLPVPTGAFAVGTVVLPREAFPAGSSYSNLQVQLFYPTEKTTPGRSAPYVSEPTLKLMREQKYYLQPDCVYDAWGRMGTGAIVDAGASTRRRFPLVLFLPGEGVSRVNYTSFAEQFASDGYVVATFDFMHDGFMIPPDETPDAGSEADAALAVNEWTQDAAHFLDKLLASETGYKLPRNLWRQIDRGQISAAGHSLGGAAALQICQDDVRVRACVDMDGAAFGEVAEKGLRAGALVLLSHVDHTDAELKTRGRTREQMEEMGKQRNAEWQKALASAGGAVWIVKIRGTGHFSFSDGPFTMPSTITRFGGALIESNRGLSIVTTLVESYWKSVFSPGQSFAAAPYPETTVLMTRASKK